MDQGRSSSHTKPDRVNDFGHLPACHRSSVHTSTRRALHYRLSTEGATKCWLNRWFLFTPKKLFSSPALSLFTLLSPFFERKKEERKKENSPAHFAQCISSSGWTHIPQLSYQVRTCRSNMRRRQDVKLTCRRGQGLCLVHLSDYVFYGDVNKVINEPMTRPAAPQQQCETSRSHTPITICVSDSLANFLLWKVIIGWARIHCVVSDSLINRFGEF